MALAIGNTIQSLLPFALSFAAGAMLYVVIEELIPASQQNANNDRRPSPRCSGSS